MEQSKRVRKQKKRERPQTKREIDVELAHLRGVFVITHVLAC